MLSVRLSLRFDLRGVESLGTRLSLSCASTYLLPGIIISEINHCSLIEVEWVVFCTVAPICPMSGLWRLSEIENVSVFPNLFVLLDLTLVWPFLDSDWVPLTMYARKIETRLRVSTHAVRHVVTTLIE